MKEKTLLDVLKEEKAEEKVEEKVEKTPEPKKETPSEKPAEKPKPKEKTINIFSAASFPQKQEREEEEREINRLESKVSSVIETPNYDLTESLTEEEHKKVFVFQNDKPKKETGKFKLIIISILFAIFGVWGIVNVASLDSVGAQLAETTAQYELNLFQYLKNLYTLDATNSQNMQNLFETIPQDENPPTQLDKESNFFDRLCNFLAGLFGG